MSMQGGFHSSCHSSFSLCEDSAPTPHQGLIVNFSPDSSPSRRWGPFSSIPNTTGVRNPRKGGLMTSLGFPTDQNYLFLHLPTTHT